jgi:hypothetical protein
MVGLVQSHSSAHAAFQTERQSGANTAHLSWRADRERGCANGRDRSTPIAAAPIIIATVTGGFITDHEKSPERFSGLFQLRAVRLDLQAGGGVKPFHALPSVAV